jgi:hypothetical protein
MLLGFTGVARTCVAGIAGMAEIRRHDLAFAKDDRAVAIGTRIRTLFDTIDGRHVGVRLDINRMMAQGGINLGLHVFRFGFFGFLF